MEDLEFYYELRHKKDKTKAEELLLKYRSMVITISEILIDESKYHISTKKAIKSIREYIVINNI